LFGGRMSFGGLFGLDVIVLVGVRYEDCGGLEGGL